ncbi:MAG: hypothetical protein SXQ77_11440, partial [Halobacteria archaeon]|nr:hypothetical protein [Halobacteria archaeon]
TLPSNDSTTNISETRENQNNLTIWMSFGEEKIRYDELPENRNEVPRNDKSSCASFTSGVLIDVIQNRTDREVPIATGVGIYENDTEYISVSLHMDENADDVDEVDRTLKNLLPSEITLKTRYKNQTYHCSVDVVYEGRKPPLTPH